MPEIQLTPKQRQQLKGAAHRLDPVVLLGAGGLTDAVVKEIDRALTAHELIKVRVPGDDRTEREDVFREVAERLGAARVQMIGKLLVLFRPRPEPQQPSNTAPGAGKPTPAKARPIAPARAKPDRRAIRAGVPKPEPRRPGKRIERGGRAVKGRSGARGR